MYFMPYDVIFFFFFQAEDGIRDVAVTGVQTCALPISARSASGPRPSPRPRTRTATPSGTKRSAWSRRRAGATRTRSEEHTSELQSRLHLVCRLLLEKKKNTET